MPPVLVHHGEAWRIGQAELRVKRRQIAGDIRVVVRIDNGNGLPAPLPTAFPKYRLLSL